MAFASPPFSSLTVSLSPVCMHFPTLKFASCRRRQQPQICRTQPRKASAPVMRSTEHTKKRPNDLCYAATKAKLSKESDGALFPPPPHFWPYRRSSPPCSCAKRKHESLVVVIQVRCALQRCSNGGGDDMPYRVQSCPASPSDWICEGSFILTSSPPPCLSPAVSFSSLLKP